jgi:hypothetical protein
MPDYIPLKEECMECSYISDKPGNQHYKCHVQGECPAFNDPGALTAAIIDREILNNMVTSTAIIDLTRELITLLDKVETSDNGNEFRPNYISSCRCMDGTRLNEIVIELKKRLFK